MTIVAEILAVIADAAQFRRTTWSFHEEPPEHWSATCGFVHKLDKPWEGHWYLGQGGGICFHYQTPWDAARALLANEARQAMRNRAR